MSYILQNFFQSGITGKSYLTFEWTNQHGSGGNDDTNPHKMNTNIVLQYMCQWVPETVDAETLRNGINTNTPKFTASNKKDENANQYTSRKNGDKDINRGLHESWDWYEKCRRRERNQGEDLIVARKPNLVPRVLWLFGQQVGARRDSGELEKKFYLFIGCPVKACIVLQQF